ncbi:hypothetical protein BXZ70DRAFT_520359 [Cristinia sonorae]|uniref:Secreted protein n=1 Tax=Cristinia sonorae TaxID=1940300 RepID=A0A8K0UXL2_9AGAR|nr:hypothetical protein BXZ70DRAFT_520359 [Cristinia sonorae]
MCTWVTYALVFCLLTTGSWRDSKLNRRRMEVRNQWSIVRSVIRCSTHTTSSYAGGKVMIVSSWARAPTGTETPTSIERLMSTGIVNSSRRSCSIEPRSG